jgi:hypothetical protein
VRVLLSEMLVLLRDQQLSPAAEYVALCEEASMRGLRGRGRVCGRDCGRVNVACIVLGLDQSSNAEPLA